MKTEAKASVFFLQKKMESSLSNFFSVKRKQPLQMAWFSTTVSSLRITAGNPNHFLIFFL
jgi:hypothetical protein